MQVPPLSPKKKGLVFWFTGLSGAGKTTIAQGVANILKQRGKEVRILDGDVVRDKLNKHLGFSPEDIMENNRIIAEICAQEKHLYDYTLVPVISPFEKTRKTVKEIVGDHVYMVYISTPLNEVIRRDVKGLYQKALKGELKNFIGIAEEVPYQVPENPDLVLDGANDTPEVSVKQLLDFMLKVEM